MLLSVKETPGAVLLDYDGDELRVESTEDGRFYVTASQEECTATVGPFTRGDLEALMRAAEGGEW